MAVLDSNEIMFNIFQPKVKNRFIMYIDGIPSFTVKSLTAPGFTDTVIKMDHINTYRKLAGKREWKNVTMTLFDPLTPSAAQSVMDWARLSYETVTGRAGYLDFYKKDIVLNLLGPVGDIVAEWIFKGSFIIDTDFGDMDWADPEVLEITVELAMDGAILNF